MQGEEDLEAMLDVNSPIKSKPITSLATLCSYFPNYKWLNLVSNPMYNFRDGYVEREDCSGLVGNGQDCFNRWCSGVQVLF